LASKVRGFPGSRDIRAIQLHAMSRTKGGYPVTRISMTILLTGTALAMLAAPALSLEATNRLSVNGINPNGVNPNGLSPNGLSSPGRTANSGELGRVVAVELPRGSEAGISVRPALP
jgi:hypothetical protein